MNGTSRHPGDVPSLETDEIARRVRAARAYAGLTIPQLAERIGVGERTIKRVEMRQRIARTYELWAIADACGVPRWFFETEFQELTSADQATSDLVRRVGILEARVADLSDREESPLVRQRSDARSPS